MDRKTIFALLAVTASFLLFTSEPWLRLVRYTFGIPEPVAVSDSLKQAPAATVSVKDTATPSLVARADPSAPGLDSAGAINADSLRKLTARKLVVRTETMRAVLAGEGGRLEALELLSVVGKDGKHPSILPQGRNGALTLKVGDDELTNSPFVFVDSSLADSVVLKGADSLRIKLVWNNGKRGVVREYVFRGQGQGVGLSLRTAGYDKPAVRMSWNAGLLQIDPTGPKIPFGPPHFNNLVWRDIEEVTSHGDQKAVSASGPLSWVGLRGQYAMTALVFDSTREGDLDADTLTAVDGREENSFRWSFRWRPVDGAETHMQLLATPLESSILQAWGYDLDKVLFNGWGWFLRADIWFPELCLFVLGVLKFFHSLIPNWGIAIILLTIAARLAVFPLTLKQVKQAKRMAAVMPILKPKLDALKEKYKNEPRKVQEETMRLYNEHGINPLATMAGCLPMFLQMPVFFALYMVLGRAIELRGAPFFGWISDLALPDVILPMIKIPFIFPLGIAILPIFMAASLLWLNKLTIKDPQQQALVWIMPIMMLVFSGSFPSGLVLYWTVSNLFSVAQTWLTNIGPLPTEASVEVGGTPVSKKKRK